MAISKPQSKGGRQAFKPSARDIELVESMAKVGITREQIAKVIGIDRKTLAKHFHDILETASTRANAMVAQSLYQNAVDGNVTAQIFWAKTRMGWKETNVTEHTGKDGGAIEIEDVRSRIEGQLNRLVESKQHKQLDETLH